MEREKLTKVLDPSPGYQKHTEGSDDTAADPKQRKKTHAKASKLLTPADRGGNRSWFSKSWQLSAGNFGRHARKHRPGEGRDKGCPMSTEPQGVTTELKAHGEGEAEGRGSEPTGGH